MMQKKFVTAAKKYCTFEEHVPAPLFRKSFLLEQMPDQAPLAVSGLGFYDLFVNGQRITKGLLAPYISNPDDLVYYDCYDIAPYLRAGENVIGVILGNGMQNPLGGEIWDFQTAPYRSAPKFALELELDGKIITAEDFVCTESALLFDDLRCGIVVDAGLEHPGWNKPGYDQEGWRPVICAEVPRGELRECEAEPVRVRREIAPVSILPGEMESYFVQREIPSLRRTDYPYSDWDEKDGFLVDFGINSAGIFRLKICGHPGQKVSLVFGETLTPEGKLDVNNLHFYPKGYVQRCIYICKGGEEEVFEPPFTYYGFRYCYVTGIRAEQAIPSLLTYLEAGSALETRGGFSCSDPTANKLFEMADRSDRSNFYYFPTDCPHREKNGWTGDAAASAEHMILHLGVENSWREWLNSIRKAQNDQGALPGIVPTTGFGFDWGNGPAWDCVLFTLPYISYVYRGETEVIRENAHAMLRYLEYVSRCRNERGIVEMGLGDWAPVNAANGAYLIPLGLSGSIMTLEMCRQAEVMFDAVDLKPHKAFAHGLREELLEAVRREYLDFGTMTAAGNCQSSQAMCLYYGVFTTGERPAAFARLMEILEQDGFAMNTGFLGGRVLFHVLAEGGEADLAYQMITRREFPSYGKWVEDGETTLLEAFQPEGKSCGSHNHHFWGDILHWFMRHLAGINVNPHEKDPNDVLIRPRFVSALDQAKGYYDTPAGRVSVSWERKEEEIFLTVQWDPGVKCRIQLESGFVFEDSKRSFLDQPCENAKIIIQ